MTIKKQVIKLPSSVMDNIVIPTGRDGDERPSMGDLHTHIVIQYAAQWEMLGLELGLKPNDIAKISENNARHPRGIELCCAAVLKEWLRKIPSPTWDKLDSAIKKIKQSPTVIHSPTINSVIIDTGGNNLWTQRNLEQTILTTKGDVPLPPHVEEEVLQSVVILLVTGNRNEYLATHSYLKPLNGHDNVYRFNQGERQTGIVIYYIGNYGVCPAAVRDIPPGFKVQEDDRTVSVMASQCFPNLNVIISVGVACGIEGKVNMLDVLVSTKIINYENSKVEREGFLPKGEPIAVSSSLKNFFIDLLQWPDSAIEKRLKSNGISKPRIKSGVILSGPYPSSGLKRLLVLNAPEAIGIETEGAHLFVTNQHTAVNVMVVKVVYGFGDVNSSQVYQPTAALLAADVINTGLTDSKALKFLTAKRVLRQMVQQAKNDGLTISVRHGKILFCGASRAGKTSFYRLLRNKSHKDLDSTNVGHAKQVLISEKVNLVGTDWVSLDSNLETRALTDRLILKLRQPKVPKSIRTSTQAAISVKLNTKNIDQNISTANISTSTESFVHTTDTELTTKNQQSAEKSVTEVTHARVINSPNLDKILENQSLIPAVEQLQLFTENQIANYNDKVITPLSELEKSIPKTFDLFTLLDTGGQPEFINLLPAINASTAITFVVVNMSEGKQCLDNPVKAQYKREGFNYTPHKLKYTNMHLLKCLLSSIRITTIQTKKGSLHQDVIKVVKQDEHPQPVVCVIGTHADKLEENFGDVVNYINKRISQLEIMAQNDSDALVIWSDFDGKYLRPVDNTVPRGAEVIESSNMTDIQIMTLATVQSIRDKSKELLEKKTQYEIPISWFILELEIRTFCKNNEKVCISISDIEKISDKIMPADKKIEKWVIIEIMKFYHIFGTLLYFDEVNGLNEFVITDPQWLFTNLTKIVTCQFDENHGFYDADLIIKLRNKGICDVELFKKLNLNLQDIKIEYFLKLLVRLKVMAPKDDSLKEYFIPSILPVRDDKIDLSTIFDEELGKAVVFTTNGKEIEIDPLLIGFTFGTFPRGLFGFLVVQLLQDNQSYELYNINEDMCYCYADLITFQIDTFWYVTLVDHVSYLEVQVRVQGNKKPSYHCQVQKAVTDALQEVCKQFNWQFTDCRYGFLCKRCYKCSSVNHLSMLSAGEPLPSQIPDWTKCSNKQAMELSKEQKIWFEDVKGVLQQHDSGLINKGDVEITKKVYEIFRMRLIRSLPMDEVEFLGLLREQHLLYADLNEQIQATSTRADKVELFLEKAIERSFIIDDCEPFNNLLTVMSHLNNDPLKQLAAKICQEIDKETSLSSIQLTGNRHMDITRKVYERFRMQLLTSLPMDDVIFLGLLREQKLFPTNLKEQIQARSTKAQKTELFLDKAIERSLYIDDARPLHNLLTVMSGDNCHNYVHLKRLATKIKQELGKEPELMETDLSVQATASLLGTSDSGKHNKILERTPDMFDLTNIVIPKILNKWEYIAKALHYDLATITAIKQQKNSEQQCREFFNDWLTTSHGAQAGPKVWSTLLNVLEEVDEVSGDIKKDIVTKVNQLKCK